MLQTQALLVYVIFVVWQTNCVRGKKCLVEGEFPTPFLGARSSYFIGVFLVPMTILSLDRCFWSRMLFCSRSDSCDSWYTLLADVLMLSMLSAACLVRQKEMIPFVHRITNAAHWQKEWDASLHVQRGPCHANSIVNSVWKWIHRRARRVNVPRILVSRRHVLVARCVSWRTMNHVASKVDVDWLLNACGIHRYLLDRLWNRITVQITGQGCNMERVAIWNVTLLMVNVPMIKNVVSALRHTLRQIQMRVNIIV